MQNPCRNELPMILRLNSKPSCKGGTGNMSITGAWDTGVNMRHPELSERDSARKAKLSWMYEILQHMQVDSRTLAAGRWYKDVPSRNLHHGPCLQDANYANERYGHEKSAES
ncbi:unnamed protein product [Polarella glacialis]|uniref:Uncharacterized protein n=1 Tax=Polarella glacialis TaxID=89957 RepID=A0A813H7L9_POLGL|nr:unnamed protein product [Polarella glacialis]